MLCTSQGGGLTAEDAEKQVKEFTGSLTSMLRQ
jgi:hypothetical protein